MAEDSQTSLAMVRDLLEAEGYQVVVARDGLQAMEAVYREGPDVVLLDVEMPRMNGYQVCRMLKLDEETSRIPVVMLTSRDQPADQFWGFQTGADSYVTKGQPAETVLKAVQQALKVRNEAGTAKPSGRAAGATSTVDILSRLNDALDRKLYEATILGEVSKLAWTATDPDRTAQKIMSLFGELFTFHLACMLMRAERSRAMELLWMVRSPTAAKDLAAAEETVLSSFAAKSGVVVDRQSINRRIAVGPGARLSEQGEERRVPASFLALPIGTSNYEAGVFALWGREGALYSSESIQMMGMLANAASVVLDNARLYQEMQRLATTDGLTGLTNYRGFQERLEQEFQRSRRLGEPLALLMLDLDDFKTINDTYGHKGGDQALQAVAAALARSARRYDLIARYGGEEFVVVLPSTDARGALEAAERLRLVVRAVASRLNMGMLSTSVGGAVYPGPRISDAQGLMREADSALYRAKAEGKNRVHIPITPT